MKWLTVAWGVVALLFVSGCVSGDPDDGDGLRVAGQAVEGGGCLQPWCAEIGTIAGDNCYVSYPTVCGGCAEPACGAPNGGCLQPWCADIGALYGDFCSGHYPPCAHCAEDACGLVVDDEYSEPGCLQPMCETIGLSVGDACRTQRPDECGACPHDSCAALTTTVNPIVRVCNGLVERMCPEPDPNACARTGEFGHPDVTLSVTDAGHPAFSSSRVVGDLDDDGFDELAVTHVDEDGTPVVLLFYGPLETPLTLANADATFLASVDSRRAEPHRAGDFDGDGFDDWLVDAGGGSYLMYGGMICEELPDGWHRVLTGDLHWEAVGDSIRGIRFTGWSTGGGIFSAGDLNDDDYDDLLIYGNVLYGGPRRDTGEPLEGTVNLQEIFSEPPDVPDLPCTNGPLAFPAGNVNGDDYDDVLVNGCLGPAGSEAVMVLLGGIDAEGNPSLTGHLPSRVVLGEIPVAGSLNAPSDAYLTSTILFENRPFGDFNGDGNDDVHYWVDRRSYVAFGPIAGAIEVEDIGFAVPGLQVDSWEGPAVTNPSVGDFNGDGFADFIALGRRLEEALTTFHVIYGRSGDHMGVIATSWGEFPEDTLQLMSLNNPHGAPVDSGLLNDDCILDIVMRGTTGILSGEPSTDRRTWIFYSDPSCPHQCEGVADGTPCGANNACMTGTCRAGQCETTFVDCGDPGPCGVHRCDIERGCVLHMSEDGEGCFDGDHCTQGDYCEAGVCIPGADPCDGQDPCACICDPRTGDNNPLPPGARCDDGLRCTTGDECAMGVCRGTFACDDDNSCTIDACDEEHGCGHATLSDGAWCNDQDLCTAGDTCLGGTCQSGPHPCEGQDPCSCTCHPSVGRPVSLPDGQACGDEDECRVCDGGACTELTCDGGGECRVGECVDGACSYPPVPDGTPCISTSVFHIAECISGLCVERCPSDVEIPCNFQDDDCNPATPDNIVDVGPCGPPNSPCYQETYFVEIDCLNPLAPRPSCEPDWDAALCADVCRNSIDDNCNGVVDEVDGSPSDPAGCVGGPGREEYAEAGGICHDNNCNRTCVDDCYHRYLPDRTNPGPHVLDADGDGSLNEEFEANCDLIDDPDVEAICNECNGFLTCETLVTDWDWAPVGDEDDNHYLRIEGYRSLVCNPGHCPGETTCRPPEIMLEAGKQHVCGSNGCDPCNGLDDDGDGRYDEDFVSQSCPLFLSMTGETQCLPGCHLADWPPEPGHREDVECLPPLDDSGCRIDCRFCDTGPRTKGCELVCPD